MTCSCCRVLELNQYGRNESAKKGRANEALTTCVKAQISRGYFRQTSVLGSTDKIIRGQIQLPNQYITSTDGVRWCSSCSLLHVVHSAIIRQRIAYSAPVSHEISRNLEERI